MCTHDEDIPGSTQWCLIQETEYASVNYGLLYSNHKAVSTGEDIAVETEVTIPTSE